jgi:uncharacterized radical SAM superfamily protein
MKAVEFIYPQKTFPVSLTRKECALNCAHCGGHYISHMSSKKLYSTGLTGARSCLVSGGCNIRGEVPLSDNIELIRSLASNFKIVAHTGLITEKTVNLIAPYIKAASFNLLGSDRTIHDVYGLDRSADDFFKSYRILKRVMEVYPHITLGLRGGEIAGEYSSLDFLSKEGAPAIVINVLIPTKGTRFYQKSPPPLSEVEVFLKETTKLKIPIYIGCMRPSGKYRTELDRISLELGVDRIVKPSQSAIDLAKELDFNIKRRDECCVL